MAERSFLEIVLIMDSGSSRCSPKVNNQRALLSLLLNGAEEDEEAAAMRRLSLCKSTI